MDSIFSQIHGFEMDILNSIEHIKFSLLDKLMIFFTTIGELGMVWISISIALLIDKKYRKAGITVLLALLIGTLLCDHFLKIVIGRERPFTTLTDYPLLINEPDTLSFPSGHTTSSFAAAGVLAYYLKRMRYVVIPLAILVSFSRLYLFVHYPSDVFVGLLLGLFSSFSAIMIMNLVTSKSRNKKSQYASELES